MDIERFWELNSGLPPETAAEALRERLAALAAEDIAAYQAHFDRCFDAAYRWDLWGAAYLIGGGCSDDGFIDFRYGLISRGRAVYEAALADPDSLAGVAGDDDEGFIPNEDFGYVAGGLHRERTGADIPRQGTAAQDPTGEEWDFDDAGENASRLPRLWKAFGWD